MSAEAAESDFKLFADHGDIWLEQQTEARALSRKVICVGFFPILERTVTFALRGSEISTDFRERDDFYLLGFNHAHWFA